MARCPYQVGTRVRFTANPAAMAAFYTRGTAPKPGTEGVVRTVAVPGGQRACMPGPRGGLVYVDWDGYGFSGVFAADLEKVSGARRGVGGLRGTPAEHGERAAGHGERAAVHATSAARLLRNGQCVPAYTALLDGAEQAGMARRSAVDSGAAGRDKAASAAARRVNEVANAFRVACVIPRPRKR